MSKHANKPQLRLHCGNFSGNEVAALRSLLILLDTHLRHQCVLVDQPEQADVVFYNAEVSPQPTYRTSGRVVGCATRPSTCAGATLHRPLRAYEIVALMDEVSTDPRSSRQRMDEFVSERFRYRLRAWPTRFDGWAKEWLSVMAAITKKPLTVDEIGRSTGASHAAIDACLAELWRLTLLDRREIIVGSGDFAAPLAPPPPRWRNLAGRIGQILGFRL